MKVTPENYAELKAFFAAIWPIINHGRVDLPPADMPTAVLERFEHQAMARARAGLAMAVSDIVELCENIAPQSLLEIDQTLSAQKLPTLSAVRARFLKKTNAIMRRGSVRSETEYHALRNVADAMPEAEGAKAWAMLRAFETR